MDFVPGYGENLQKRSANKSLYFSWSTVENEESSQMLETGTQYSDFQGEEKWVPQTINVFVWH